MNLGEEQGDAIRVPKTTRIENRGLEQDNPKQQRMS